MKRFRPLVILLLIAALCWGGVQLVLFKTAHYPALSQPVDYPVNQLEGFALSLERFAFSPFKGHSFHYDIEIDSDEVYFFVQGHGSPERLEREIDGQWYRMFRRENDAFNSLTFDLGGEGSRGFSGSLVQEYAGYGTRMEPGRYRFTVELADAAGAPHYLAAEFIIP